MNRRGFLSKAFATSAAVAASGWLAGALNAACGAIGRTHAQTEGPYYKSNPPQRASLREPGLAGEPLLVTGRVLDADCRPVPNAKVDFWHADAEGDYDNDGYRLRGYQFTDADGHFRLETILPGVYPGRTRHIHVKITPHNQRTLTTQLYFPGEPGNARDGIFEPDLVMKMGKTGRERVGAFDFVVQA